MHSVTDWKFAKRPNYITNVHKNYPYSDVPYLECYSLVKLPTPPEDLVELVDYWGEGRIVTQYGISGFSNCYNVNHPYQLVSNGPDCGRKIPNRIPVENYDNCDTSNYIKDNSVSTVTVMGAPINHSCARDISRIVNQAEGKVVAYGFDSNSEHIQNLSTELMKRYMFYCPSFTIPAELQDLTIFNSFMVFVNLSFFGF